MFGSIQHGLTPKHVFVCFSHPGEALNRRENMKRVMWEQGSSLVAGVRYFSNQQAEQGCEISSSHKGPIQRLWSRICRALCKICYAVLWLPSKMWQQTALYIHTHALDLIKISEVTTS